MDKYKKVENPNHELPVNGNEIRITSQGLVHNYITYATTLLQRRGAKEIILKAMGQAITKAVTIAEIIKREIPRLYQDTAISSVSITDTFEPIEEGLQIIEHTRHVSMISITLSTKNLNMNSPGYQAPSNGDQTNQQYDYRLQQPPRQAHGVNNSNNTADEDNYESGRGCGRGGGRGRNRGGYAEYRRVGYNYADIKEASCEDYKRVGYNYVNNKGDGFADNRNGYEVNQSGGNARNRGAGPGRERIGSVSITESSESCMGAEDTELINVDDPSTSLVQSDTSLISGFRLKNRDQIKKFEEEKDCIILEFDPSDELKNVNLSIGDNAESDLCIVAEKGQVACRNYPHPRNFCAKFPFEKTPHESYCGQCYCFVCDLAAPCEDWIGIAGHCHAYSNEAWKNLKELKRQFRSFCKGNI